MTLVHGGDRLKDIYESILDSIKKMIGVDKDYGAFDVDLIIAINGVFTILNQLGVGPEKEFAITGPNETWLDFFGITDAINLVKPYMYLKVKLIFDPPSTGVLHEAMERQISEFEWRLAIQADPVSKSEDEEDPLKKILSDYWRKDELEIMTEKEMEEILNGD